MPITLQGLVFCLLITDKIQMPIFLATPARCTADRPHFRSPQVFPIINSFLGPFRTLSSPFQKGQAIPQLSRRSEQGPALLRQAWAETSPAPTIGMGIRTERSSMAAHFPEGFLFGASTAA